MRIYIEWVQQGQVNWEKWWLKRHGPTRTRVPTFDDHLSFVNFSLTRVDFPKAELSQDGRVYIEILDLESEASLRQISEILSYHGFRIVSIGR